MTIAPGAGMLWQLLTIGMITYAAVTLAFLSHGWYTRLLPKTPRLPSGSWWGSNERVASEARLRDLSVTREPTILTEVREILHENHECQCNPSHCVWMGPGPCPTPWMHHQEECPVWQGLGMGIS